MLKFKTILLLIMFVMVLIPFFTVTSVQHVLAESNGLTSSSQIPDGKLDHLEVDKKNITMKPNDQTSIVLSAVYTDGSKENITNDAEWKSKKSIVASVVNGLVKAQGEGNTVIIAIYDGKSVEIPIKVEASKLKSLTADKKSLTLKPNDKASIVLNAVYTDGLQVNVTNDAKWTTSKKSVAEVEKGVVTSKSEGSTIITAIYGYQSVEIPVKVEASKLKSLVTDRKSMALKPHDKVSIVLTAVYMDGSEEDVTNHAEWKSKKSTVASVENGLVTAQGEGNAAIIATYDGKSVEASVKVEASKLKSLTADKKNLTLKPDDKASISLTAVYTDGSQADVTQDADWTTSKSSVAEVEKGMVTSKSEGSTIITVIYGGKSVEISVKVEAPKLKSLVADKNSLILKPNEIASIVLTAVYMDGSQKDVTNEVDWTTSKSSVVEVEKGLVTSKSEGTATVTAIYSGKSVEIPVKVEVVKFKGLVSDKKSLMIKPNAQTAIVLMAVYTNGSQVDVTQDAEWSTSNNLVVEVEKGLVTSKSEGDATVTAIYSGNTVEIPVKVEVPKFKSLTTDKKSLIMKPNDQIAIVLNVVYTDGSQIDVTQDAEWTTSKNSVVGVEKGLVTSKNVGSATVTAIYSGYSVEIPVKVEVPKLKDLVTDKKSLTLKPNDKASIVLNAVYTDGSKIDVTQDAEWKSKKSTVASVMNGVVTAQGEGKTVIIAAYEGKSVNIGVTVK